MEKIIEFRGVSKIYGRKVKALSEISFAINTFEFVGIIGNNGAGKTTLINSLCNVSSINEGEIFVFDRLLKSNYVSYRKKFGILLSNPYFIEKFTIYQYLNFVGKFQGVEKNVYQQRIEELADFFELSSNLKRQIKELSSGNKMKVSLIAAMVHNPDVLVLDEPYTYLDYKTQFTLTNLLQKVADVKTILVSSHNIDVIENICSRFLYLENGQLVMDQGKETLDSSAIKKIKSNLAPSTEMAPKWLLS